MNRFRGFGKLLSWSLYDFANTIFSAIVLTAYFPLYFTELTRVNWMLGAATTGSMILAGLAVPYLGALSDRTGKTKRYLLTTTLACIFFLLGFPLTKNPLLLILLFTVSCFFYHAALVFYNSLLPAASEPEKQGFASGLGTGLGYLGVLFALPAAHYADTHWGRPQVFNVCAVLFFVFSLPVFLWVPEREEAGGRKQEARSREAGEDPHPALSQRERGREWEKIAELIKSLPQNPALLFFFAGNFLVLDAVNSTIFWFLVYGREVFHPGQKSLIMLMMEVNAAAFLFGIVTGYLTDRFGAMKIYILSGLSLALTLGILAVSPGFAAFAWASALGGGFALAGAWTAGRKALVDFAPAEKLGQYFGLYGLTTKISVVGSLVFSILADLFGFRAALWSLILPAAAGTFMLWLSTLSDSDQRPHDFQ